MSSLFSFLVVDWSSTRNPIFFFSFGLCGVRTGDNAGEFEKPVFVAYFTVDYDKNPKGTNYWRNR